MSTDSALDKQGYLCVYFVVMLVIVINVTFINRLNRGALEVDFLPNFKISTHLCTF